MSISECHMQKKRKYLTKKNMNNFVTGGEYPEHILSLFRYKTTKKRKNMFRIFMSSISMFHH